MVLDFELDSLNGNEWVTIFLVLYAMQALVFTFMAFASREIPKQFPRSSHDLFFISFSFKAILHLAAAVALVLVMSPSFSSSLTRHFFSWMAQISGWGSALFLTYCVVELADLKRISRSVQIKSTVYIAVFSLLALVAIENFAADEDKLVWKLLPRTIVAALLYGSLSIVINPIVNRKMPGSFWPISACLMAYASTHAVFSFYLGEYSAGFWIQLSQFVVAACLGFSILQALILKENDRSKKLDQIVQRTQRVEEIGRMTSSLSHDFNNLLTMITLSSERVQLQQEPGSSSSQILKQISDAAQKGSSLTRQMLQLSKPPADQDDSQQVLAVDEALDNIQGLIEAALSSDIELKINSNSPGSHIHACKSDFEMVMVNLVINSRDAIETLASITTMEKKSIDISTRITSRATDPSNRTDHSSSLLEIRVTDNGIGMSTKVLDSATDLGFSTKGADGTGLGLSSATRFARESGGTLQLKSTPRLETSVIIRIPLLEVEKAPTVLIIDHNSSTPAHLDRKIRTAGYSSKIYDSIDQAKTILKLELQSVKLVIHVGSFRSDESVEFDCRYLELNPQGQILRLGAQRSADDQLLANQSTHELSDPFSPGELIATLNHMIGTPETDRSDPKLQQEDDHTTNSEDLSTV